MDTFSAGASNMETSVAAEPDRMGVDDLKNKMDRKELLFIIDTRSSRSWRESNIKIPGAVRIHSQDIEQRLTDIPRDRTTVAYCT